MDIITIDLDDWGTATPRRRSMRSYSIDVRQRIVAAVEAGEHSLRALAESLGVDCSIVTIFRTLTRKGITRKKKTRFAEERDSPRVQEQRRAFCKEMAKVDADHVVFIDETGATTAMGRTYGRAPVGERVQATAPGAWKNVTLITGMRRSGVIAPMALPGATDRQVFDTYVEQALVPELR